MFALIDNYSKNIDKKIYNAGLYLRISKEDEISGESESITNQKDYISRYVIENGWNLTDIYIDDGYTGTNFNRPEFKRMLKDLEAKKINMVITKDMSRLGRDYIDTGYYIERYFPEHDIRYIAINDGIDTFALNNSNNDMSPFKSVMNDMYAKDISKKIRTSLSVKKRNGEYTGAFTPYGYIKDPKDKNKLLVDPDTVGIVKRIYEMYVGGQSFRQIQTTLNNEGILSPGAYKQQTTTYKNTSRYGLWSFEGVKQILINRTYTGDMTQGKFVKLSYKIKKSKQLSKDLWVTVENTHEPIIDIDTFELVQKMIARNASFDFTDRAKPHLLAGLMYCADCGGRMTFMQSGQKDGTKIYYAVCSSYKRYKKCTRHSIKETDLEACVINDLKQISEYTINREKFLEAIKDKPKKSKTETTEKEIKAIEVKLQEIKKIIKSLYEDKIKNIIDETTFMELTKDYSKERDQLQTRLVNLEEELKKHTEQKEKTTICIK